MLTCFVIPHLFLSPPGTFLTPESPRVSPHTTNPSGLGASFWATDPDPPSSSGCCLSPPVPRLSHARVTNHPPRMERSPACCNHPRTLAGQIAGIPGDRLPGQGPHLRLHLSASLQNICYHPTGAGPALSEVSTLALHSAKLIWPPATWEASDQCINLWAEQRTHLTGFL